MSTSADVTMRNEPRPSGRHGRSEETHKRYNGVRPSDHLACAGHLSPLSPLNSSLPSYSQCRYLPMCSPLVPSRLRLTPLAMPCQTGDALMNMRRARPPSQHRGGALRPDRRSELCKPGLAGLAATLPTLLQAARSARIGGRSSANSFAQAVGPLRSESLIRDRESKHSAPVP